MDQTSIAIGDRVQTTEISVSGFREVYLGTVVNMLPIRHEAVVVWDKNKVGARQAISIGRLLKKSL